MLWLHRVDLGFMFTAGSGMPGIERDFVTCNCMNQSLVSIGLSHNGFATDSPKIRDSVWNFLKTTDLKFIITRHTGRQWGFNNFRSPAVPIWLDNGSCCCG